MTAKQAVVRHARREEAQIILDMIQELADYERESDAVKATVQTIQETVAFAPDNATSDSPSAPVTEPTSPTRPSRCLLLFTPEGEAAGMALYFYNYSTWRSKAGIYLEDLFVRPQYRGKGYGKRLLVELSRQVLAMDGGRLEWVVLKWNEPSIKFYESIGAVAMNDWVGMRVDGEGLNKLARSLD
ncbi:unnamed protein product [Clonostachys solani]|uniref:N-acetyltransferase domain-containing protein n=1 Tax=Clonostachys solani TaxID=160281 RepID=A0A9N9ZND7_9HYPO|nr:unnamed protein product [Clonostachys solani]